MSASASEEPRRFYLTSESKNHDKRIPVSVFYGIKFLNTRRGQLATALGCYVVGEAWHSDVIDHRFTHAANRDDVVASGTLLPDHAPAAFRNEDGTPNACAVWNAADRTGISTNKRHKQPIWKKRAQLAMHVYGTVPYDAPDEICQEIVLRKAEQFRRMGAAVTWATHRPSDPESRNLHFHLVVSTRRVEAHGFGRQIRSLAASFSRGKGHTRATIHKDSPGKQWRAELENFACERGIEFDLGVPLAIPGVHWGDGPRSGVSRNKVLDAEAKAAAQALVRDPLQLLALMTKRQAVFTRRDLDRLLRAHEIPPEERELIISSALANPEILHLRNASGDPHWDLFTTRTVRAQEMRILDAARRIHNRGFGTAQLRSLAAAMKQVAAHRPLSREQKAAMARSLGKDGLTIIQGLAGAGKSFTMSVIREALEHADYRVVGVAPTNAVSSDMAADGFHTASTIHQELLRQETGTGYVPWDDKTCIIVDEAAMLDAGIYERLMVRAAEAGARVVLVGDDKQLSSIERGGSYAHLRGTFGCALLREVRRQTDDWAKEATLCFPEGRTLDALRMYYDRGYITWHGDIAQAAEALVAQRSADRARDPGKPRFVIAATRAAVWELNQMCQRADWVQTPPAHAGKFATADGEIELGIGDRVQFAANDRQLGIVNGMLGTVLELTEDAITVKADSGQTITFNPTIFDKWGLGFAGTVFRSQGRTHSQVYCLYDHAFAWGASTSYVAFSRHRESVRCYVPQTLASDLDTLARQMSKSDPRASSLEFVSEEELRGEIEAGPAMAEHVGAPTIVKPADAIQQAYSNGAGAADSAKALAPQSEIVVAADSGSTPSAVVRPKGQEIPIAPGQFDMAPRTDILLAGVGATGGGSGGSHARTGALPALPFKAPLAGRDQDFDLSLPEHQEELLHALVTEPMPSVVSLYRRIQNIAKSSEPTAAGHLRAILAQITMQSKERGFIPRDNEVYRDSLRHVRPDPQNIMMSGPLKPGRKEVDTRPMVEPLYQGQPRVRRAFAAKMKGFVIEALRAIDDSLAKAVKRAGQDDTLRYPIINTRLWLYDLTYSWNVELRPDVTKELGHRATPDEYRDFISLARKAEAADMPEIEWDPLEQAPAPPKAPKRYADSHILREIDLMWHYRRRITAQVAATEAALIAAKARRPAAATDGQPFPNDDEHAIQLRLDQLRRKHAAFERDNYGAIRSAPALDFLPAAITEEHVAAPRSHKFRYLQSAGFRAPDLAIQLLEDLLLGRLTLPASPAPTTPEGMPPARRPSHRSGERELN